MKRVLFVVTYFDCGGTCRSLQNLLNMLNPSEYAVDVFGLVESGMYEKGMFNNCSIIPADRQLQLLYSRYSETKGITRKAAALLKIIDRISGRRYNTALLKRAANKITAKGNYDMVVAFSEGIVTKFLSFVNHPNKVAWIHCDYANYHRLANYPDELQIYNSYKTIVCVSDYTKSTFTHIYPTLTKKTYSINNILDTEMMRNQAEMDLPEGINFDSNVFNIVSVGRLDPVKRLSIIPEIARLIIDNGVKIKWWIVGPKGGTDNEFRKLTEEIEKKNLKDSVIYVGEQSNPYPFIKNANLLVNTSVSEACPYVINEAKVLGTPVVCTDFGSAAEFIEQDRTGVITSIDTMADAILRFIKEPALKNIVEKNLTHFLYDNKGILDKFNNLSAN